MSKPIKVTLPQQLEAVGLLQWAIEEQALRSGSEADATLTNIIGRLAASGYNPDFARYLTMRLSSSASEIQLKSDRLAHQAMMLNDSVRQIEKHMTDAALRTGGELAGETWLAKTRALDPRVQIDLEELKKSAPQVIAQKDALDRTAFEALLATGKFPAGVTLEPQFGIDFSVIKKTQTEGKTNGNSPTSNNQK